VGQDESDDLILPLTAGDVAALASNLPQHEDSSQFWLHV
jgi:hypothetical protein